MAPLPLEHDYIGLSESPDEVSATFALDLRYTELRIGLPWSESEEWMDGAGLSLTLGLDNGGFSFSDKGENAGGRHFRPAKAAKDDGGAEKAVHSAKAQVVGWPPIRSYRKNTMAANPITNNKEDETQQGVECLFIKVSMDGAPYLRKVDLKTHSNYKDLSLALEKMFTCFTIGHYGVWITWKDR